MNAPFPFTRRRFATVLLSLLGGRVFSQLAASRALDFRVAEDFGDVRPADVLAVISSAAKTLWQHCPNTRWEVPGFFIFHRDEVPITLFDHRSDGRVAIGLTTRGPFWAQFTYQFSHEFCHALADHTNDWKETWLKAAKANHWLEESLCEAASLFALRAMSREWETAPPYPNWKSYAGSLGRYATDRMEKTRAGRPEGFTFAAWFREHEESMRANATIRQKNNVVALEVLPLFEAEPAGWEAMTAFNRVANRDPQKTLARHFADWIAAAPEGQRAFLTKLASVFGVA